VFKILPHIFYAVERDQEATWSHPLNAVELRVSAGVGSRMNRFARLLSSRKTQSREDSQRMGVFINFRNGDGREIAHLLDQEARRQFGDDRVFLSSRSIEPGEIFPPALIGGVERCYVLLAVIGPNWLKPIDGKRRIDDPDDWVRREIATALTLNKRVIPILIGDRINRLSVEDNLPPDIAGLVSKQSVRLNSQTLDSDVHSLLERLIQLEPDLGIGVVPGLDELAKWWDRWSKTTDPALPSKLPLAGRGLEVNRFRDWLQAPAAVLTLCSYSIDDALAFVAAVRAEHRPEFRAVLVRQEQGASHCERLLGPLLVVLRCDEVDPRVLSGRGHHVVVLREARDPMRDKDSMVLPRLSWERAYEVFEEAGVPDTRARQFAAIARRSLLALRRRLAVNTAEPVWASGPQLAFAAPLLLAGSWSSSDGFADHDVLTRLIELNTAEVERFAGEAARSGDPLLHRSGTRWQLADPQDAWTALCNALTDDTLNRWHNIALAVLTERDPLLEIPPKDRSIAKIRGVRRVHSDELRQGIAKGAGLLGAGEGTRLAYRHTAEEHARALVRAVLERCNDDTSGVLWQSVAEELPLLAEASPPAFLAAVRKGLIGENPLLRSMYTDAGQELPGRFSPHTYLLWALESLCWSPEHLPLAVRILARLAEIDPGGRTTSRPLDTLRRVLLPMQPYTCALADLRLQVIDGLRGPHPAVWWSLLLDLLPSARHIHMQTYQPKFRDKWIPDQITVPPSEWITVLDQVVNRTLVGLAEEPSRWSEFVPRIGDLSGPQRDQAVAALSTLDADSLREEDRLALWNSVTAFVARHRQYSDAEWALPEDLLSKLATYADRIEPAHLPHRHARLFGYHPHVPGVDPFDYETKNQKVEQLRKDAVRDALETHGTDSLCRLAERSELPALVGAIAADVSGDALLDEIEPLLGVPGALGELARGWVARMASQHGQPWSDRLVSLMPTWSAEKQASLLLTLSRCRDVLPLLEGVDQGVNDLFWRQVPYWPSVGDPGTFFDRLLEHHRPWSVVEALSLALHDTDANSWTPPADLIARTLTEAAQKGSVDQPDGNLSPYAIGKLLDFLATSNYNPTMMVRLELIYRTFLLQIRKPHGLYRWIADDPRAYREMVSLAHADSSSGAPMQIPAMLALREWRSLPGTTTDGQLDGQRLKDWVQQVRELLAENDDLGQHSEWIIGEMLSGSPEGEDGVWPAEPVRDLLDEPGADRLADGFLAGVANNRGVTARWAFEGGKQERNLAARYDGWAERIAATWPQASLVLKQCVARLREDARRWDDEAEDAQDET
jgi:hypothetical protein